MRKAALLEHAVVCRYALTELRYGLDQTWSARMTTQSDGSLSAAGPILEVGTEQARASGLPPAPFPWPMASRRTSRRVKAEPARPSSRDRPIVQGARVRVIPVWRSFGKWPELAAGSQRPNFDIGMTAVQAAFLRPDVPRR